MMPNIWKDKIWQGIMYTKRENQAKEQGRLAHEVHCSERNLTSLFGLLGTDMDRKKLSEYYCIPLRHERKKTIKKDAEPGKG